jgi:hypothetical protein
MEMVCSGLLSAPTPDSDRKDIAVPRGALNNPKKCSKCYIVHSRVALRLNRFSHLMMFLVAGVAFQGRVGIRVTLLLGKNLNSRNGTAWPPHCQSWRRLSVVVIPMTGW